MKSLRFAMTGWMCLILGTIHGYNHSPGLATTMYILSAICFIIDMLDPRD